MKERLPIRLRTGYTLLLLLLLGGPDRKKDDTRLILGLAWNF